MKSQSSVDLSAGDWSDCEDAARTAAIAGGISCMSYFRGALANDQLLTSAINAPTMADVQATSAILNSLADTIPAISAKLNLGHSFFAEELELESDVPESRTERDRRIATIIGRLGPSGQYVKRTTQDFEKSFNHCIAVLFDALDGTTNFRAGLPLFCSAVALFVEGSPRVGAIYDPNRNIAYCASLRTDAHNGAPDIATAYSWPVSAGYRLPLTAGRHRSSPGRMIASHLTRSNPSKRQEMIHLLEALSRSADGTFMLNSGLLALAFVATGELSAFITNYTNTWDIAAGSVLVRAVGGQVTDFDGNPIRYGSDTKIAAIATTDERLHEELLNGVSALRTTDLKQ